MLRNVCVEINLDNIRNNIKEVKKKLNENVKVGAVVKANAYGHGSIEIAKILEDENVDYICVAGLNEAIELRNANIKSKILIMGHTPDDYLDIAIKNNITLTVFCVKQAIKISRISKDINKTSIIHIKVDTGFNRLGFKVCEKLENTIEKIYNLENICVEGIFSHLALKDTESDINQFKKFEDILSKIKHLDINIKHICDSIAMVRYNDFQLDMVRVGASIYGYNSTKTDMNLKPAMTFKSKISQIKTIKKGEGISYDYSYVAKQDMKIGTISCGYCDGIPRILSNKGYVFINGKKANIVGKICMDQCMVDLTFIDGARENDEVIFYGNDGPDLLDLANLANTNRNELLSIVSRRVVRVYIQNNKIYKVLDYLNGGD